MQATPKRGRRLGGSSAHQKAMMGNLVASLIAAESIVTTEAKAKALRPVAEKCVTAARKGGVRQPPQRGRPHPGQGHDPQALRRDRPPLRGAARAATPASSSWARAPVTTRPWRGSSSSSRVEQPPALRTQRWRLLIAYDGAAFRGFAVQPEVPTVAGALRQALERTARLREPPGPHLRRPHRRRRARPGPGRPRRPAGLPYDGARPGPGPQPPAGAPGGGAPGRGGRARLRRPPLGHRAAPTATWSGTPRRPTRCWRPSPGTCATLSTSAPCAPPPTCCSGTPRLPLVLPPAGRAPTPAEPIVRRVTRARWSVDEGPEATDADGGGRGGPAAALRDRRRLLLPPDGPLPGGQPGRGGPGQGERGRAHGAPARRHPPPMPDPAPAHGLCLVSVAYGPDPVRPGPPNPPGPGSGQTLRGRRTAWRRLLPQGPILVRRLLRDPREP